MNFLGGNSNFIGKKKFQGTFETNEENMCNFQIELIKSAFLLTFFKFLNVSGVNCLVEFFL